jgi:hypothetical protein
MLETDIAGLLSNESIIHIGRISQEDDKNICIITLLKGKPSQHVFGQQDAILRYPYIQIEIRDDDYSNGYGRCETVVGDIDGLNNVTFQTGNKILSILMESDIEYIGQNNRDYHEWMMIFKIILSN